ANTKANIGMLYHEILDFDRASAFLNEAYFYHENQNQSQSLNELSILGSLAAIESDKANYKEALHLFNEILICMREIGNKDAIAKALGNRALVYARMGEYLTALSDYKESIQISKAIKNIPSLKSTMSNLGSLYLKMDSLDQAIQVCEKVIELHKESPSIREIIRTYHIHYEANKKKQRYETALEMLEHHTNLRNDLISEESSRKLIEQKYKYEYEKKQAQQKFDFEKKQAQIVYFLGGLLLATILFFLILQRIRKQKFQAEKVNAAQEAAIKKEEEERTRFARDLHDQVGSTLTLSLFNLESLKHLMLDQSRHLESLHNSIDSIQTAMADIRRISYDIHPQSLEKGGLVSATTELLEKVMAQGIQVRNTLPKSLEMISNTEEVHIYRILKGLISNTLQYAEASLITLTMESNAKVFTLTYMDDGKGMNLEEAMARSKAKGQGLIGIKNRCTLIGAESFMKSSPGNGFEFNLIKEIKK
ncbi:MAG: tetratricopeptide repeat protein, partial [Bacteroidetes bacterium]|nr:tetratricopeptide repeat protein [Bacteroidota bacterium]